jgi:hypothetical protein
MDDGLFLFAVDQFNAMARRFREYYRAVEFPINWTQPPPRAPAVTRSAPGKPSTRTPDNSIPARPAISDHPLPRRVFSGPGALETYK